jgi:3-dehydroquinate synthase class II
VKIVQQISYAQEMKELTEQQGVAATNSQNIASKQLHEGYDMLQSSSLMARVQDLLATEGRDWRFIPLRGLHFRGLGSSSNIHDVPPEENIGFSHCYLTKKLQHYL